MFDKNPKATPADRYVAGKTAEAIVRAVEAAPAAGIVFEGEAIKPAFILTALVARYDRKAAAREQAA